MSFYVSTLKIERNLEGSGVTVNLESYSEKGLNQKVNVFASTLRTSVAIVINKMYNTVHTDKLCIC